MTVAFDVDSKDEPPLSRTARVAQPVTPCGAWPKVASAVGLQRDLEDRPGEVQRVVADLVLLVTCKDVTDARRRCDPGLRQRLDDAVLAIVAV